MGGSLDSLQRPEGRMIVSLGLLLSLNKSGGGGRLKPQMVHCTFGKWERQEEVNRSCSPRVAGRWPS